MCPLHYCCAPGYEDPNFGTFCGLSSVPNTIAQHFYGLVDRGLFCDGDRVLPCRLPKAIVVGNKKSVFVTKFCKRCKHCFHDRCVRGPKCPLCRESNALIKR